MINILFAGKNLRVRRRETIINPPKGVKFFTQQSIKEMLPDHKLTNEKRERKIFSSLNPFATYGLYIKKKFLNNVDLIYSPGKIILNRKPWIIEVDNVVCMAFYRPKLLKVLKPFIKQKLRSKYCKGIICLSEAAKKGVINYFKDKNISKKCHVVYPYMKEQVIKQKKTKKKIDFLFISSAFYVKGGREILHVFEKLKNENVNLTIISKENNIRKEEMKLIRNNPKIKYVEANLTKDKVFDYYKKSDVFLLPTYRDSFGLVYLEALSFGVPIIATKQYNLPEVIKNNGILIKPAFYYFDEKGLPNDKYWIKDLDGYILDHKFTKVEKELYKVIKDLIKNPKKIDKMRDESSKIFKNKFEISVRNKHFGEVLKKCAE